MNMIKTLFFDIGGVLLTNGWDHDARERASIKFSLDQNEIEKRHDPLFKSIECGTLTTKEYLDKVIFYKKRDFSHEEFFEFMKSQSKPLYNNLDIAAQLSKEQRYRLYAINNESLDLNTFRVETFGLYNYFQAMFSSCFLGVCKPDVRIFQVALNILHQNPSECLLIDDREENVESAKKAGLDTIHLPDASKLKERLVEKGILFNY
jgi:putative hydrolase of the HAD superfamily